MRIRERHRQLYAFGLDGDQQLQIAWFVSIYGHGVIASSPYLRCPVDPSLEFTNQCKYCGPDRFQVLRRVCLRVSPSYIFGSVPLD